MNLLNKLTIKNLKLNKKRTIVTIIGIILSVALITAVASMYASGIKSLINYETHEKGDFHVAFYNVPEKEIDTFENNRKIETINITQNIGYAKIDSKNEYKPYAYVKAFTSDSLKNLSVKLVEGKLPQNENEILIPTHLKTNGRVFLNVGDTITLNVGKRVDNTGYELNQANPFNNNEIPENIVDTIEMKYKIVGIIERPATNIEQYSAPGYTFITYIDKDKLSGNVDLYTRYTKEGMNNVYKVTANILGLNEEKFERYLNPTGEMPGEDIIKFSEEVEKAYQISVNQYLIDLETNPISSSNIGGLGSVVGIVISIIVVTSVFCIKNSFDISITEKTKQYGMLRSIGATKKQIKKNVFFEATVLGIIGIPLGILFGFLASFILIIISNYFLSDNLTTGFELKFASSYISILVSFVLGIITIYFSAFRSAKRASKISPIDSIRNSGNIKIKNTKLKTPKIIKRIFGIGGEISYKNLQRNKKKYRTTVISIIVSVFVFIALSSFMSMSFDSVNFYYGTNDYNVSLMADISNTNENTMYKKLVETTRLDNIENVSILRTRDFTIENPQFLPQYIEWCNKYGITGMNYISVYTVGTNEYHNYLKKLGLKYEDMKNKGILINSYKIGRYDEESNNVVYERIELYDYKIGDNISGKINDKYQYNFNIGFITDENPFGLSQHQAVKLIISDEMFEKLNTMPLNEQSIDARYFSNNPDKLQNDIEQLLNGESYRLNNDAETIRSMNRLFTLIGIFLYGFIIVISLIGITNIFNTITTNMELRKQEFAMLKSIGMTHKEFSKMIRLETVFMGVKSLFFGVPIGIGLSYLIYHFLQEESGIPYKLPIVAIIISIIAVFILISSLMKYSMNKINKQNTIETIRNENI